MADFKAGSSEALYSTVSPVIAQWSQNPATAGQLTELYRMLQATPLRGLPLWNLWGEPTPYPPSSERDFDAPHLVRREKDERFDVERLWVASPAMRREVQVQIQYPKDRTAPAPMLYLLDGVSAPVQSGWLRKGDVQGALANEHVTAVMAVEAGGTNYTDWNETDPYLGRSKWETFLTQELPGVLEAESTGIAFNGERYIGGLSMGGAAAARLANLHPQLYTGAFSISSCYSTTSTSGRELLNLATRAMGGKPEKMWGVGNTPQRLRNDITANPAGLASMRTYFYVGNGNASQQDLQTIRPDGVSTLVGDIALEKLANTCTHELEDSMTSRGMAGNAEFDYHDSGVHEWSYYKRQLPAAWASVSQGKYTYR